MITTPKSIEEMLSFLAKANAKSHISHFLSMKYHAAIPHDNMEFICDTDELQRAVANPNVKFEGFLIFGEYYVFIWSNVVKDMGNLSFSILHPSKVAEDAINNLLFNVFQKPLNNGT